MERLVNASIRVCRFQDRLLMAGPLAEDGIEPEADKQCNQRKDHDNGQSLIPMKFVAQHNAHNAWIQRALPALHRNCAAASRALQFLKALYRHWPVPPNIS